MSALTRLAALVFAALLWPLATAPSHAHVTIDNADSKGGSFKARFNVTHGCEGSPTTSVRITIPEGVIGVKPMPKPGWTLTTTRAAYARTYDFYHGRKVSEGVTSVTWSGGRLLDEHVDEFVLTMFITPAYGPGASVHIPVEQTCETGKLSWSEIPAAGQSAHDLKAPAPSIRIVAATAQDATPVDAVYRLGALAITNPWVRATPGGAVVGAGYMTVTNTGTEADRLTGGAFDGAARVEIHDMTRDGEIIKMRRLDGGLEIPPGATVTLTPGGKHLMLMDLAKPVIVGAPIRGNLTFEKASTVDVEFVVRSIGSPEPAHTGH